MTTVLYDEDCGFCRWSVARLLAWDRRGRLRAVAIQSEEGQRLLAALPEDERLATAHAVTADGRLFSGGDAFAPVVRDLPAGAPLATLARLFPGGVRWGYRAVAARRSFLGKLVRRGTRRRRPV